MSEYGNEPSVAMQQLSDAIDQLDAEVAHAWSAMLAVIGREVDATPDLATLQRRLSGLYGCLDTGALVNLMAQAFALAELKAMAEARGIT